MSSNEFPTLCEVNGRWKVIQPENGEYRCLRSFEDKCQAEEYWKKQVALLAGTLQSILFGWRVEGVGHPPLFDISPDAEPVFRIETLTRHSRTFSHLEVIVDLNEET
jgi:hypothetical protein